MDKTFSPQETDARRWADHWIDVIQEHPGVPTDRETMVTWFANAIMAGFDMATRRSSPRDIDGEHNAKLLAR